MDEWAGQYKAQETLELAYDMHHKHIGLTNALVNSFDVKDIIYGSSWMHILAKFLWIVQ
jgi:hypothetical protein